MDIELTVAGKRIRITPSEVIIWNPECWDGEDETKLEELMDSGDFAFYDRSDGAPYYWKYPIEEVVDAIDAQIARLQVLQLRNVKDGKDVMSNGCSYVLEYDSLGIDYLYDEDHDTLYWVKEVYASPTTGEIRAYLVTDEA